MATTAARGESGAAENWGAAGGPEEGPLARLSCCQTSRITQIYERGVGDSEGVARFEGNNSNKGKNLPPGGDNLFLN